MKTRLMSIAIFLLAISQNLTAQDFDFRKVNWGMDSTQVKLAEKARYIDSKNNRIMYAARLDNLDAKVFYYFNGSNKLCKAFYVVTMESKNPSLYVKSFLMLQQLLSEKYNDPISNSAYTINGRTITQDEWASNLLSDNLNLETKWKNHRTEIVLSLYSISDDLVLDISYTSLEYGIKADPEKTKALLKDL